MNNTIRTELRKVVKSLQRIKGRVNTLGKEERAKANDRERTIAGTEKHETLEHVAGELEASVDSLECAIEEINRAVEV